MKKLMTILLVAAAAFAAEGYHILNKIKIGGTGGWDYVTVDSNAHRLYATHGTTVDVVDLDGGKVVGSIPQLHGVHHEIAVCEHDGLRRRGRAAGRGQHRHVVSR